MDAQWRNNLSEGGGHLQTDFTTGAGENRKKPVVIAGSGINCQTVILTRKLKLFLKKLIEFQKHMGPLRKPRGPLGTPGLCQLGGSFFCFHLRYMAVTPLM